MYQYASLIALPGKAVGVWITSVGGVVTSGAATVVVIVIGRKPAFLYWSTPSCN